MKLVPHFFLNLTGSGSARFVDELLVQVDAVIAAAALTRQIVSGEVGRASGSEQMRDLEHAGDDARAVLVGHLSGALVTPIDREDLFRLSRSIDDIIDNLRDFVRAWDLFEMEKAPIIEPVLAGVCDALSDLRGAVATLKTNESGSSPRALAAKKSGNGIRRAYDVQLAALYRGEEPPTMETLKLTRLMRCLDVVGIRYAEATDHLSDGLVKRAED